MALEIGSRLGHYDVTAKISEGGMGEVYRATDTTLGRDVALTVLPQAFRSCPLSFHSPFLSETRPSAAQSWGLIQLASGCGRS